LYPHPTYNPTGGVRVIQEARDLPPSDAQIIFRNAESNLDALNAADLGPRRPSSVGGRLLWARLTGPKFAAQVTARISLVPCQSWVTWYISTQKSTPNFKNGHSIRPSMTHEV
jgi:hypothetical protein